MPDTSWVPIGPPLPLPTGYSSWAATAEVLGVCSRGPEMNSIVSTDLWEVLSKVFDRCSFICTIGVISLYLQASEPLKTTNWSPSPVSAGKRASRERFGLLQSRMKKQETSFVEWVCINAACWLVLLGRKVIKWISQGCHLMLPLCWTVILCWWDAVILLVSELCWLRYDRKSHEGRGAMSCAIDCFLYANNWRISEKKPNSACAIQIHSLPRLCIFFAPLFSHLDQYHSSSFSWPSVASSSASLLFWPGLYNFLRRYDNAE